MKKHYFSDFLYSEQMFGCAMSLLKKINNDNMDPNGLLDTKRSIIGILRSAIMSGQAERVEIFWQLALIIAVILIIMVIARIMRDKR